MLLAVVLAHRDMHALAVGFTAATTTIATQYGGTACPKMEHAPALDIDPMHLCPAVLAAPLVLIAGLVLLWRALHPEPATSAVR